MNNDFEDMFSMRGAYVDDDGIEIGSNDVTPQRQPQPPQPMATIAWRKSCSSKRPFSLAIALASVLLAALLLLLR